MAPLPIARPFAGLRYARADLSGVLAPPYDVISPDDRDRLLARDPHNMVRLELSYTRGDEAPHDAFVRRGRGRSPDRPAGGDPSALLRVNSAPPLPSPAKANDRYAQAARTLREWREQGILRYDEGPSLYPYAHDFTLRGVGADGRSPLRRVGVLCAVRLSPFASGLVLPHEGTLRGPREDRRALMLACRAQISPVLALHDDPDGRVRDMIAQMTQAQPIAFSAQTDAERHRLWHWPADDLAQRYCESVGQGPLFVADGHHRYETALAVSRELQRDHPDATLRSTSAGPQAAFNYVLMLLCPTPQAGVVILPAHRLLKLRSQEERDLLEALVSRHFTMERVRSPWSAAASRRLESGSKLPHSTRRVRFGMFTRDGGCALLTAKTTSLPPDPGPGGYNELATVLVHRLLIDPVVGAEGLTQRVHYVTDEAEAVSQVLQGRFECALFVPATTVMQVQRVALAGLRMPGKSTYFYPKAPAGLVISDISPGRVIA